MTGFHIKLFKGYLYLWDFSMGFYLLLWAIEGRPLRGLFALRVGLSSMDNDPIMRFSILLHILGLWVIWRKDKLSLS